MPLAARVAAVVLLLAGAVACGTVQANSPVLEPALVTPDAPPRVIVPTTVMIPEPDPGPVVPPRPSQPAPNKPAEQRTVPATNVPAVPIPVPEVTPTTAPPPVLQTASNVEHLEQTTRGIVAKANSDLRRVDVRDLGADARAQYDTAKGFIRQAEDALKEKNLVYAKELADKAAALAGLLVKRRVAA